MSILKKGILALSFAAAAFSLNSCSDNAQDIVRRAEKEAKAVDNSAKLEGIEVTNKMELGSKYESYIVDFETTAGGKKGDLKVQVDATVSDANTRIIRDARVISYKSDISDTLKLR